MSSILVFWHLKQIGKVKKLISGCLMSWPQIRKIIVSKYHLPFILATVNHFSIRLWCMMKSGFYTTAGSDQLSGWTKKKLQSNSQSQTCTKKRQGHGHCLVVCPSDPLHLSESWQNHYIWEIYSASQWDPLKTATPAAWHWSTEWTQFFSMTMPDRTSHNQCFRS